MDKKIKDLLSSWQKHNIEGFYCPERQEALTQIFKLIPVSASIGVSGSVTLEELKIAELLEQRGNTVFNQAKKGLSREESMECRRKGAQADFYLTSANALALSGEMVFLSAWGQRIAGIANAKNVLVICGTNKISDDLQSAIKRAREYVTPLNYKRLNWDPARQMECQTLVIKGEAAPGRLKVILINEKLGF